MPNAQVVADRFHVMAQINKELDSQRKREKRQVEDLIKKAESLEKKADQEKILEGLKSFRHRSNKTASNSSKLLKQRVAIGSFVCRPQSFSRLQFG
jgi:transposase